MTMMLSLLMVMTMKVKTAKGKSLISLSKQDLPFYTLHPFLNKSVLILFDVLVSNSLRLKQCTLLNAYNGCLLLSWQMLGAFNITQLLCLFKI